MKNLFGEEKKEIVQEKIFDNLYEGKLFPEVENKSFNVDIERIEKLKELFPNIVSDNKIDWKTLKLMLGENVTEEDERYRFTWSGKSKAIREISIPTSNTLRPDKESSKNWDITENLYVEGDNLEVLKILQNSYNGKIKMIYIDPPYNTGNDFIYEDDFTLTAEEAEKQEGIKDKKGVIKTADRLTKNSKDSAKYHTNWLNMIYPRLSIARDLLTDDGIIFISIDDNEVHNLRKICDEIFGESNFVVNYVWQKKYGPSNDAKNVSSTNEHILMYSKNIQKFSINLLPRNEEQLKAYKNIDNDHRGEWRASDLSVKTYNENCVYEIEGPTGIKFYPPQSRAWAVTKERFIELLNDNRITFGKDGLGRPMFKKFLTEVKQGITPDSWLSREKAGDNKIAKYELKEIIPENIFDTPKPTKLIELFTLISTSKTDIILDFFSGSSTTAHSIMNLNTKDEGNRKYIMVQVPELSYEGEKDKEGEYIIDEKTNLPKIKKDSEARKAGFNYITEIGKERIRRAGKKILADNPDKDLSNLDIGFKTFKVDSSNFNEWDTSYEAMKKSVLDSSNGEFTTYKSDRSELDLVYEIILKEGMLLTEIVEEVKVGEDSIYKIADGLIYIFLGKLNNNTIEEIINMKKEAQELIGIDNPTIILNETYLDTEIKSNAKKNFEANGIINIKTL